MCNQLPDSLPVGGWGGGFSRAGAGDAKDALPSPDLTLAGATSVCEITPPPHTVARAKPQPLCGSIVILRIHRNAGFIISEAWVARSAVGEGVSGGMCAIPVIFPLGLRKDCQGGFLLVAFAPSYGLAAWQRVHQAPQMPL